MSSINIYIYDINVMNQSRGRYMFRRLRDVLNKYEAELVVSCSCWMKDMITVSTE